MPRDVFCVSAFLFITSLNEKAIKTGKGEGMNGRNTHRYIFMGFGTLNRFLYMVLPLKLSLQAPNCYYKNSKSGNFLFAVQSHIYVPHYRVCNGGILISG